MSPLRKVEIFYYSDYQSRALGINHADFYSHKPVRSFRSSLKIVINKKNKYLWQKASGKNTIDDIINNSNSSFKYSDIYNIYSFYQKLQNNFAIIFREF